MLSSKHLPKIREHEIWGFDTETTDPMGDMAFAWVTTPRDQYFFDDKFKLIEFFKQIKGDIWIVGHNVVYDLNTLFPEYNPKRLEWGGSFISAETFEDSGAFFVDLFKFIQKREKEIAASFGVEYIDQHRLTDPDIIKACLSHAETARLVLTKLQDIYIRMGGQLKFTASSAAFELFLRKYLPYPVYDNHPKAKFEGDLTDDNIKSLCYKAYHGGATEIFRKGLFPDTIMLDVVSMYPSQMLKIMPDIRKWFYSTNATNFNKIVDKFEGAVCCDFVMPEMLIPPFIYSYEDKINKVLSHTGLYSFQWITFPEYRYLKELGAKILKIREFVYYKKCEILFKAFIADMWKYKKEKDTKYWAKLNMNGASGKFGQRNLENTEYVELEELEELDIEEHYTYQDTFFKIHTIESGDFKFNTKAYPIVVAYVTAYARIHLHRTMMKLGLENILYCDTDSIAVINHTLESIKKLISVGSNLGDFELQWQGAIDVRGLKYYRYREDLGLFTTLQDWIYKIKGVPLKYHEEFWEKERVIVQIPRKLRSAIRYNKKVNEWFFKPYVSKNKFEKRIFAADGTSKPYHVD